MKKVRSARRVPEAALGAVQGGDAPPPPPADLKQHVDNPGQTAMP